MKILQNNITDYTINSTWLWGDIGNYYGAGVSDLTFRDNTVEVYLRDQTKINLYQTNNHHDSLDIKFDNIYFHNINSINNIKKTDRAINIIATSSSGFLPIIKDNIDYFQSCDSLSWITKGLDHDSGLLFHEVLDQVLSRKVKKCVISGPSFAKDLVAKKPLEVSRCLEKHFSNTGRRPYSKSIFR